MRLVGEVIIVLGFIANFALFQASKGSQVALYQVVLGLFTVGSVVAAVLLRHFEREVAKQSATPSLLTPRHQLSPTAEPSIHSSQPLLQEIDKGFSEAWWTNYHQLVARREAGSIEPDELRELTALTDTLEEVNVRRMACFQAVSSALGMTLKELMDEADLKPRQA